MPGAEDAGDRDALAAAGGNAGESVEELVVKDRVVAERAGDGAAQPAVPRAAGDDGQINAAGRWRTHHTDLIEGLETTVEGRRVRGARTDHCSGEKHLAWPRNREMVVNVVVIAVSEALAHEMVVV